MSLPNQYLFLLGAPLQANSSRPQLTLAMPAVVALLAAFLVDHGVATTLRTKIASDA